jgi:hypothetical protein
MMITGGPDAKRTTRSPERTRPRRAPAGLRYRLTLPAGHQSAVRSERVPPRSAERQDDDSDRRRTHFKDADLDRFPGHDEFFALAAKDAGRQEHADAGRTDPPQGFAAGHAAGFSALAWDFNSDRITFHVRISLDFRREAPYPHCT